ncbi:hypothetical protein Tsubulata_045412, partial [Turnera subulata]
SRDLLLHQSSATEASRLDDKTPTIDEVIEKFLGSFGWSQFLQCILVSLAQLFDGQQVLISVFADAEPPWHCIESSTNCSSNFDICKISSTEWAWDAGSSKTTISEWSLQCASPFIKALPASSFFMGSIIGGFTLATLGDSSLGRKKLLFLSSIIMSLASLATIFSTNVWLYSACRFISGVGRASIGSCVLVLLTEKVGKNWRGRIIVVGILFITIGYMSLPGIAYITRGSSSWRSLYLCTSIPAILYCILLYFSVTESPKWLLNQGREEEAFATLRGLAHHDDKSVSLYLLSMPQKQNSNLNNNFYSSFNILLSERWALRRILAVMVLCFGIGMVYYGMPLGVGNLGYNIYLSSLFHGLLELPSYPFTFIVVDKWDRRGSIFWFCVLSGILSLLCVYSTSNFSEEIKVGLELGSFFCARMACSLGLIYTTELFPTSVRNTATSMARMALVSSAVFSPALISAGKTNSLLSYGVFGIVILLCSLCVYPLPETRGAVLIGTIYEQEEKYGHEDHSNHKSIISQSSLMAETRDLLLHQSSATEASRLDDNTPTIDEVIEKFLGSFGWSQFLQCILVSLALLFDAQQVSLVSNSDICKISKSEWDWDAGSSKTIISEWSLQCASPFTKAFPASSFFMGSIIGGFTLATLGDSSLGRKKLLFLSLMIMSLASLTTIFSTNVWLYSAFRFISGVGRASLGSCVLVLLTEKVGKNWRGRIGVMGFLFGTIGYMSLPGIAYINKSSSWRSLYLCTSIPAILYCVLLYFSVTESPKWLFNQGREEEAFGILKGLTSLDAKSRSLYLLSMPHQKQNTNFNNNFYSSFNILLSKRWALRRILAVMVLCFGIGMVYFGMELGVGNLGYNIYLSSLFNAILELPSYPITFIVVDKWNRRGSIFWFSVLSGIFSILCVYSTGNFHEEIKVGLELGSFFCARMACSLILIHTTELFPTAVRNSATSIARQAFALSAVFSPALISVGKTSSLLSYGVFGIVILTCSLFVYPLPETRGAILNGTIYGREENIGQEDHAV